MDYVKFNKAQELHHEIFNLKIAKDGIENILTDSMPNSLQNALGDEDYKRVISYITDILTKRIENAEDEFRLL